MQECGAGYVFVRDTNQWVQRLFLKADTGTNTLTRFGTQVTADGDSIVVSRSDAFATGRIYVFR